jgi:phenylalanyl-tRNA synthetase beta chain
MKFSYNWLKEYVPRLPAPEKVAEVVTLHAFEVEGVEELSNDTILDIAILPNRIADASGHVGMARELAAVLDVPFKVPSIKLKESARKTRDVINIKVESKLCSRYIARVVENVSVGESPEWLRERLEACGLRSINNIVDITNYVMLQTGQPLHAFDLDKLEGQKIIVRNAQENEHITTLDGEKRSLNSSMLVIADEAEALAIAGIKGGAKAEIDSKTTTIVLEAACFDGPSTRTTSQTLGLRTDASVRFSVGIDPNLAGDAIDRAAVMVQELAGLPDGKAGGQILKMPVDIYPKKRLPRKIALRVAYANSVLGTDLSGGDMVKILKRLGFRVNGSREKLAVTVPTYRVDIMLEEDLVEEVGRIYGYYNVKAASPLARLTSHPDELFHDTQESVKNILVGLGFFEASNYSFVGKKDIDALGDDPKNYFELMNPVRPEFSYMRHSLLPGLLRNAEENLKHVSQLRMFEIGAVYSSLYAKDKGDTHERKKLGGFIAAKAKQTKAELFYELKGALSTFFDGFGLDVWFDDLPTGQAGAPVPGIAAATSLPAGRQVFQPYRSALIKTDDTTLGILGELHPRLLGEYGIKGSLAAFELDFEDLTAVEIAEKEFRFIPKFPAIERDVAVLVPTDVRVETVLDMIENTGGELLVDTDVFDIYEGQGLPENRKSFAFRLTFQSSERTLRDEEIEEIMNRVTKTLEENPDWEVRK